MSLCPCFRGLLAFLRAVGEPLLEKQEEEKREKKKKKKTGVPIKYAFSLTEYSCSHSQLFPHHSDLSIFRILFQSYLREHK